MGVKGFGFHLDDGNGDVGAVVSHAFVIGEQVVEHKTLQQRTDALLQTLHMVGFHLIADAVDDFLQRLHAGGGLHIVINKAAKGNVDDLRDRSLHNR